MVLETAIFYLVALALPGWLLVEEVVHRERGRARQTERNAVPSTRLPSAPGRTMANRAYSR